MIAAGSEACEYFSMPEWLSIALAVAAIALVGLGTYKKGFIAVRNLNFNMNALMAVAVTGAVLIGFWPEAAMVMVLFELSEAIEQLSLDRARGAIRSLLSLAPKTARVERDGTFIEVPAKDIKIGEVVRVVPGERLPVDGVVLSGQTSIDQSPIPASRCRSRRSRKTWSLQALLIRTARLPIAQNPTLIIRCLLESFPPLNRRKALALRLSVLWTASLRSIRRQYFLLPF